MLSPFLLNYLIEFLQSPTAPVWQGYMYAIGMLAAAMTQTFFQHQVSQFSYSSINQLTCSLQYFYRMQLTGAKLRSTLITSVFEKSLRMNNSARQSTTVGAVVNLMTVDAQVCLLLRYSSQEPDMYTRDSI